ncbi:hypothetical protein OROGR_026710 [Orobanche gracilis]
MTQKLPQSVVIAGLRRAVMVGDLKSRTRPFYTRRCSRRVRPTSIDSLPNELLSDILLRLPADYLFDTAKLVSRRWCHIIRSREFVHTQVQKSTYGFILCFRRTFTCGKPTFLTVTQGRIETRQFSPIIYLEYFASCNGLALMYDWTINQSLQIINPATHETLALPPHPIRFGYYGRSYGIGYAAASMVYKVIVPYKQHFHHHLSILTVGVDNSWREVRVEHLHSYATYLLTSDPLVTEGFIHYVGRHIEYQQQSKHVVTLDVETEILTVSEVEVPLANPGKIRYYLSTGRFLSMLVGCDHFSWEVWGMESGSGEWSKVLPDIDLRDHKCRLVRQFACGEDEVLQPLCWVNYPEVLALCFRGESRACIFYNLGARRIDSTELHDSCYLGYSGIVHKNNLKRLS